MIVEIVAVIAVAGAIAVYMKAKKAGVTPQAEVASLEAQAKADVAKEDANIKAAVDSLTAAAPAAKPAAAAEPTPPKAS